MGRRTIIAGRYELDPLSRRSGGMGEVWFGYDSRLDRPVAVKFIRGGGKLGDGSDDELVKRFVRESRITARLEHPGVPAVYDCGTHGDDLYLVMQLVDGCPVSSLLDEAEVPASWAVAIAAQVCSVLAVAHAGSLVHRDLKPGNLMLCPDGTVKVLDFGIATALTSGDAARLTRTGVVVGTPEYMAPEQAANGSTSAQSDLYSLGVVLDEMLAGENQFAGPTALASMRNHTDIAPRPLRERGRDVPEGLERLVLWLLAKSPERRPPTARLVYERLMDFCRDLPPFPGYVNCDVPHPVRMYAAVVGRITPAPAAGGPQPGERISVAAGRHPAERVSGIVDRRPGEPVLAVAARSPARPSSTGPGATRSAGPVRGEGGDVALARQEAMALKAQSRFTQAADVLTEAVETAARSRGGKDPAVIELRIELADALFFAGDYRRAAPGFQGLAADIAELEGPGHDLVLRCRLMAANCHAAVGETSRALAQLRRLLNDEKRLGVDEDRRLELRRQIGLLELGAGDRVRAKATLEDLLPDLDRRYGSGHPAVRKVREILDGIDGR